MRDVQAHLSDLRQSHCHEIDVGGLFTRNAVVHKWKAPWRLLLLREAASWRLCELAQQSLDLSRAGSTLGARILLRSAFETLALLIFSAQSMRSVVSGALSFNEFSKKTSNLLQGSRDKSTPFESINILAALKVADKRYPGLESWYADLCETAHPNFQGMIHGYSTSDPKEYVTQFKSRWTELYGALHESALQACLVVFEAEYNQEWVAAFEALERWIEENDEELEANRSRDA
ncbi:MAG: hypothetical protein HT579_10990 [Candidatus Accumulibacter similis]|nr:MAG: hypothetical protein HT579_10990 [Candidatus Accumulibacter similis]